MQKNTHKKIYFEISLNAADFYTNQHETSCVAISFWKMKKKLILEMFILILENEKLFPKLSIFHVSCTSIFLNVSSGFLPFLPVYIPLFSFFSCLLEISCIFDCVVTFSNTDVCFQTYNIYSKFGNKFEINHVLHFNIFD